MGKGVEQYFVYRGSLIPRPSLSLSSAITILEAGKKELVKRDLVKRDSRLTNSFFPASKIVIAEESEREGLGTRLYRGRELGGVTERRDIEFGHRI